MLLGKLLHRKDNRRVGHVDNGIDSVNVDPAPRDCRSNIRFVLMIGVYDLDRLACRLPAKILDRHPRCLDGTFA